MPFLPRKLGSQFLVIALCQFVLAACSTTTPSPDPATDATPNAETPAAEPAACDCKNDIGDLVIIGEVEHAVVDNSELLQKARIDSGATTTSVGFHEIEHFERDGDKWVRFTVRDRVTGKIFEFEKPIVRIATIKQHGRDPAERPVVEMTIIIGEAEKFIEVTLTNRDDFEYPILIGRNFLHEEALVDVSKRYLATGSDAE